MTTRKPARPKARAKAKAPAKRAAKTAKPKHAIKLTVVNQSGKTIPLAFLKTWVKGVAIELEKETKDFTGGELTVAFLKEAEARALNLEYRDRDYATDVLSFPDEEEGILGDLAICAKVIARQAKEHEMTLNEELGYMILHGVLHLLGYDHERSKKRGREMFALQDRIFERLLTK